MRSKIDTQSEEAEKAVRDIRRATCRHLSAEHKVRIVSAGPRGEDSVLLPLTPVLNSVRRGLLCCRSRGELFSLTAATPYVLFNEHGFTQKTARRSVPPGTGLAQKAEN